MSLPLNSPVPPPHGSWKSLAAEAGEARPPTDLDVRRAVRRAIAAESDRREPMKSQDLTLLGDLSLLMKTGWLRTVLGGGAVFAAWLCWSGVSDFQTLADLQALLFFA